MLEVPGPGPGRRMGMIARLEQDVNADSTILVNNITLRFELFDEEGTEGKGLVGAVKLTEIRAPNRRGPEYARPRSV